MNPALDALDNPLPVECSLWDGEMFRLTAEEEISKSDLRNWLRSSESKLGRYLADVGIKSPAGLFSHEDVRELENLIVGSKQKKADALLPLRIVAKVVYHLNRVFEKSIPQPRLATLMTPERNPFADGNLLAHLSFKEWRGAEKAWISRLSPKVNSATDGNANVPVELILFSAALHDGVLSVDMIVALYDALRKPAESFRCLGNRVYADLSLAWEGRADQETRRWYPDEKIVCLIASI